MFQATEQQIQEWKNKHKDIYQVTLEDKACYVRKPKRQDLSYAMVASQGGKDAIKMQEALLNNCWLDGDKEFKEEDAFFFAASAKLSELMETKEAEIKKL